MSKFIDLTGKKIGRLTFLSFFKKGVKTRWESICECGKKQAYRTDYLFRMQKEGELFECPDCKYKRKYPPLTDKKFGRWTILQPMGKVGKNFLWKAKCECGVEKIQPGNNLTRTRSSKSCGCYARKIHSKWVNTTQYPPSHKMRYEILYKIRNSMVNKCYNPKSSQFKKFGIKNIKVCDLWRNSMKDFFEWCIENGWEKGKHLLLMSHRNEFNPENCYFEEKGKHARLTNSKIIFHKNKGQSIGEWSKELGCTQSCLGERLKRYCISKALDPIDILKQQIKNGSRIQK